MNLDTDFPAERFREGAELFIERAGAVESVRVTSVRFHRDRPVIALEGVETIGQAQALAGRELRVPIERLASLPAGVFYHHDLVGCRVESERGDLVGIVRDVSEGAGGSLLVVEGAESGGDILIPLAAALCTTIDVAEKRIVVDAPDGLLDLNQ